MKTFKLSTVGWAVPMMMGVALVGTAFAFAASRSLAEEGQSSRVTGRCVSTPLETTDIIDRKTLYIEDRSGNAAVLTMGSNCLREGETLGFEFFGSSQICRPIDADITTGVNTAVPIRCMVKDVKLLSRDEARDWRNRGR